MRRLCLLVLAVWLCGCGSREIPLAPKPELPPSETSKWYYTALTYYSHQNLKEAETFSRLAMRQWEDAKAPRLYVRMARELLARSLAEEGMLADARQEYIRLDQEFPKVPSYQKALQTIPPNAVNTTPTPEPAAPRR